RITGIFAWLASFSTASQPEDTTGARKMASTPCAMKERIALIWFSCFCCASAIFRLTPRLLAPDLETVVSAARHPDSDPICEKPTVSWAAVAGTMDAKPATARLATSVFRAIRRFVFIFVMATPRSWYLSTAAGWVGPAGSQRPIPLAAFLVILFYF